MWLKTTFHSKYPPLERQLHSQLGHSQPQGFLRCATRDSNGQEELPMSDHYWLTEAQLERIRPYFPRSHGRPRVDDRRVISGIIHVIRNGLRWRDAPEIYGSYTARAGG